MILGELLYRSSEAGITLRCGRIEHWLNASPASPLTAVSGGLVRQPTGRGVDREAKRGAQELDTRLQARGAMRGLEAEREEREEEQRTEACWRSRCGRLGLGRGASSGRPESLFTRNLTICNDDTRHSEPYVESPQAGGKCGPLELEHSNIKATKETHHEPKRADKPRDGARDGRPTPRGT
jgi:hypothetical protein